VLLAGHNPGLQELIFDLVPDENENALFDIATEKYPTATFAVLELAIDRWAECSPAAARWSTSSARATSIPSWAGEGALTAPWRRRDPAFPLVVIPNLFRDPSRTEPDRAG
jgi:hypothetical protein